MSLVTRPSLVLFCNINNTRQGTTYDLGTNKTVIINQF